MLSILVIIVAALLRPAAPRRASHLRVTTAATGSTEPYEGWTPPPPATWSYERQDLWPDTCRVGARQSPINIDTSSAERVRLPALKFDYAGTGPYLLHNTGRTSQLFARCILSLIFVGHSRTYRVQSPFHLAQGGGGPCLPASVGSVKLYMDPFYRSGPKSAVKILIKCEPRISFWTPPPILALDSPKTLVLVRETTERRLRSPFLVGDAELDCGFGSY